MWHSLNQRCLGEWDSLDYLAMAQKYNSSLENESVTSAFKTIFFERERRVTFHPIILMPILYLTNGDILLTSKISMILIYTIFLFYLYKTLRLFLTENQSLLGLAFIGTIPWVKQTAHYTNSETFLFASLFATIYYGFLAKFFQNTL